VLATLAAVPAFGVAAPAPARAQSIEEAAARVQAALKGAKGTQLVLLGTGGGPLPGQARHMTSHVIYTWRRLHPRLRARRHQPLRADRHPVLAGARHLHHPSPSRPKHRIRSLPGDRLGARAAAISAGLRPAAAPRDDAELPRRLQGDNRFLGRGFPSPAPGHGRRPRSLSRRTGYERRCRHCARSQCSTG
jgi:hypothetical protein